MPRRDYKLYQRPRNEGIFFMPVRGGQPIAKIGKGPKGFGVYSKNTGPLVFRRLRKNGRK